MARTAIIYNKITGEVEGKISVSVDTDLELNRPKNSDMDIKDIRHDHPVLSELENWNYKSGKLRRKLQIDIDKRDKEREDAEIEKRTPDYLKSDDEIEKEILLEAINEARKKVGIKDITLDDIKFKLEQKREQYRNPKKAK